MQNVTECIAVNGHVFRVVFLPVMPQCVVRPSVCPSVCSSICLSVTFRYVFTHVGILGK